MAGLSGANPPDCDERLVPENVVVPPRQTIAPTKQTIAKCPDPEATVSRGQERPHDGICRQNSALTETTL